MSSSCREDPGCSGGPPGFTGVIGKPSRMSESPYLMPGSVWLALPNIWEWSEDSPGSPGVVGRFSRMSGSSPQSLPDVREW